MPATTTNRGPHEPVEVGPSVGDRALQRRRDEPVEAVAHACGDLASTSPARASAPAAIARRLPAHDRAAARRTRPRPTAARAGAARGRRRRTHSRDERVEVDAAGGDRQAPGGVRPFRTSRADGPAVSSSSRRTPPSITRRCRSALVRTRSDTLVAVVEQRRVAGRGDARPPADSTTCGSVPTSHVDHARAARRSAPPRRSPARAVAASRRLIAPRSSSASCTVAVGVGDDRVHPQVRRARRGGRTSSGLTATPRPRRSAVGEGVDEPAASGGAERGRAPRAIVSAIGISSPAHVLGQRAHQRADELGAVAGDLPVEPVVGHPVERGQRHVHGDAVERPARVEAVRQRQHEIALAPRVGVVGRAEPGAGRRARRRSGRAACGSPTPLAPLVEAARRRHVVGQPLVVEVAAPRRRRAGRRGAPAPPAPGPARGTPGCARRTRGASPTRRRTRAWRMNIPRAPARSMRSYGTVRPLTIGRPYSVTVSAVTAAPRRSSQRGSPYERRTRWSPRRSAHAGSIAATRRAHSRFGLDELGRHHPPRRLAGEHRAAGDRERRAARAAQLAARRRRASRCATAARRARTGGCGRGRRLLARAGCRGRRRPGAAG